VNRINDRGIIPGIERRWRASANRWIYDDEPSDIEDSSSDEDGGGDLGYRSSITRPAVCKKRKRPPVITTEIEGGIKENEEEIPAIHVIDGTSKDKDVTDPPVKKRKTRVVLTRPPVKRGKRDVSWEKTWEEVEKEKEEEAEEEDEEQEEEEAREEEEQRKCAECKRLHQSIKYCREMKGHTAPNWNAGKAKTVKKKASSSEQDTCTGIDTLEEVDNFSFEDPGEEGSGFIEGPDGFRLWISREMMRRFPDGLNLEAGGV